MTSTREPEVHQHFDNKPFRHLLSVIPAGAYTCDAAGLITGYNSRAVELWGREPKLNDPVDRFCGSFKLFSVDGNPIPHDRCWMALALQDNKGYNEQEIIIERPDGERRTALAHANPILDESGRVFGAVNILVDITDRKRDEDAIREADSRKSEFLAMLSHELRNPLAPLRNGLQVLRVSNYAGPIASEAYAMMERQLGHMVRLIDDLLDLSRISKGKIELRTSRMDIASAVQDAVETCRPLIEDCGHELSVTLPPRPVYVEGDRTRLAQVIANLLNNSAKFTEPGGNIKVAVEQQGSDVVVSIRDSGAGIASDQLESIFDMFVQVGPQAKERASGGLGIGLNLVRGLVELHGGRVEALSDGPGLGSEFLLRLPVQIQVPGSLNQLSADVGEALDRPAYRILIVDDNRDAADSLAMVMRLNGHESRAAYDGVSALNCAREFRPGIVLLDIGLPGLNGYEVARQIRAEPWGENVVLIALTGWGQDEDKKRSKQAGFNFHLIKPVDPGALEKLLAGLLLTPA